MTGPTTSGQRLRARIAEIWPGVLLCALGAVAALFLSANYGAPAMLMALLIGLALQSATTGAPGLPAGVDFTARMLLRLGVGLLGARINVDLVVSLGHETVGLVAASIVLTVGFAMVAARLLGRGWRLAVLTGGSVAICGASAAVAIAAVLPRNINSDRNLSFTVFSVTLLSAIAMILYPILGEALGLGDREMAVFLGATIHDVAQVVGAGFSVSDTVGETATTVKLLRVTLLAPFVICLVLVLRATGRQETVGTAPPILPWFIVLFVGLALVNSFEAIPVGIAGLVGQAASWLLLAAIVGVGLKTNLGGLLNVPREAVALIVAETAFIAALVVGALLFAGLA